MSQCPAVFFMMKLAWEYSVKAGDLVQKRWGRIEPWQQGTLAICLGKGTAKDLMLTGRLIKVVYPGRRVMYYKPEEFEVRSEGR